MRYVLLALIAYLAAVIQTSLADSMRVGHLVPDLLALVAVVWLLVAAGPRAFLAAAGIALLGDLVSPGRPGIGFGWMLLIGYWLTRLRARFEITPGGRGLTCYGLAWQAPTVWAAVTVWAAAVGLTGRLLGDVSLPWPTILTRALGVGVYTAGIALPVLMVVGWIREPLLVRRRKLAEF